MHPVFEPILTGLLYGVLALGYLALGLLVLYAWERLWKPVQSPMGKALLLYAWPVSLATIALLVGSCVAYYTGYWLVMGPVRFYQWLHNEPEPVAPRQTTRPEIDYDGEGDLLIQTFGELPLDGRARYIAGLQALRKLKYEGHISPDLYQRGLYILEDEYVAHLTRKPDDA